MYDSRFIDSLDANKSNLMNVFKINKVMYHGKIVYCINFTIIMLKWKS